MTQKRFCVGTQRLQWNELTPVALRREKWPIPEIIIIIIINLWGFLYTAELGLNRMLEGDFFKFVIKKKGAANDAEI